MANTMSKYGSNTNRPLSEIVGLSTDTKPTDSIEGIQIQNGSSFRELDTGKKFLFDAENTTWNEVSSGGGGGGGSTLIEKSISANGIYNASEDSADGYSKVTVNVPSGGVEFKNTPTNFSLKANIDNLDVIIPYGCTSIATSAFSGCTGLTSIEIPNSVTSIELTAFSGCTGLTSIEIPSSVTSMASPVFDRCDNLEKIYVDKEENSLSDSPWGAPNTVQVIWRTHRYHSSCTEVASGTTLTGTVNATVGDLVIATFIIRGNTYTIDSGWTLLGISEAVGVANQRTAMAYKIATSSSESLTVTQDTAGRIYINLVSITGASVGTFSGFTTQATGQSITMTKPQGLVIWGVTSSYWSSAPTVAWELSDNTDVTAIQLPTTTQPRCLTALDQSNNASETFTAHPNYTADSALAAASLTITGIDNFWYYDD